MITYKKLLELNKIFKIVLVKYDNTIITLKPTQFGQYMFTEYFYKTQEEQDNDYVALEGGGRKQGGCYMLEVRMEFINTKNKEWK